MRGQRKREGEEKKRQSDKKGDKYDLEQVGKKEERWREEEKRRGKGGTCYVMRRKEENEGRHAEGRGKEG